MKNVMRKIMCWLGFHEWKYEYDNVRICWHCEQKQEVHEQTEKEDV